MEVSPFDLKSVLADAVCDAVLNSLDVSECNKDTAKILRAIRKRKKLIVANRKKRRAERRHRIWQKNTKMREYVLEYRKTHPQKSRYVTVYDQYWKPIVVPASQQKSITKFYRKMSLEILHKNPIDYNDVQPFQSTDENLPKSVKKYYMGKNRYADVEPYKPSRNPFKGKSWREFCEDFLDQNYGSIAQSILEMHNSPDPQLRIQAMKFFMEMGKQIIQSKAPIDINASIELKSNIYSKLEEMSNVPTLEEQKMITIEHKKCEEIEDMIAHEEGIDPIRAERMENEVQALKAATQPCPNTDAKGCIECAEFERCTLSQCAMLKDTIGWEKPADMSECEIEYINEQDYEPKKESEDETELS